MIRIRYGVTVSEIYVFDEESQPKEADGQYWWNYTNKSMDLYNARPTWDAPANQVTDQSLRTSILSAFEQWKISSFEAFLLQETAYWRNRKAVPINRALNLSLEALHSALKISGSSAFIESWNLLFPEGVCRLVSSKISSAADNATEYCVIPYSGRRQAGFLLKNTLPLQVANTSSSVKFNACGTYVRTLTALDDHLDLVVVTDSPNEVICVCRFEFDPIIIDPPVADSLVKLVATVLDIAEPDLIASIFDDQFKVLLRGMGVVGSEVGERGWIMENNRYYEWERGLKPPLIALLTNLDRCIQRALINDLRTSSNRDSTLVKCLGIPCLANIVNVLHSGLKWTPNQTLALVEKVSGQITKNSFVGIRGGRDVINHFASSAKIGKQFLAGYSISIVEIFNDKNDNLAVTNFMKNESYLRGVLSRDEFDSLNRGEANGTLSEAVGFLTDGLAMLNQAWLEDVGFCSDLLILVDVAVDRAEKTAKRIHDSPSCRESAMNGRDFSSYLDLEWLTPFLRELNRYAVAPNGSHFEKMLKQKMDKLAAANLLACGGLGLIDSLSGTSG